MQRADDIPHPLPTSRSAICCILSHKWYAKSLVRGGAGGQTLIGRRVALAFFCSQIGQKPQLPHRRNTVSSPFAASLPPSSLSSLFHILMSQSNSISSTISTTISISIVSPSTVPMTNGSSSGGALVKRNASELEAQSNVTDGGLPPLEKRLKTSEEETPATDSISIVRLHPRRLA